MKKGETWTLFSSVGVFKRVMETVIFQSGQQLRGVQAAAAKPAAVYSLREFVRRRSVKGLVWKG